MKKVELMFYRTKPSEKNAGLKHVLWEITDKDGTVTHDWGFGFFNGESWESLEVPEGYSAKVHSWANTTNPASLVNENRIIPVRGNL